MKYFFTADEHYGHTNIIKYCNRPFSSVEEMDKELIKRHNEVVGKDDIVYHLGDFSLLTKEEIISKKYIKKLNGSHIFLIGSHDYWLKDYLDNEQIIEKKIDGLYIVMCHYAMRHWPRSFHGSIQLHGHSHGQLEPIDKQLDVGVDCNNYYPFSLEQIKLKLTL